VVPSSHRKPSRKSGLPLLRTSRESNYEISRATQRPAAAFCNSEEFENAGGGNKKRERLALALKWLSDDESHRLRARERLGVFAGRCDHPAACLMDTGMINYPPSHFRASRDYSSLLLRKRRTSMRHSPPINYRHNVSLKRGAVPSSSLRHGLIVALMPLAESRGNRENEGK